MPPKKEKGKGKKGKKEKKEKNVAEPTAEVIDENSRQFFLVFKTNVSGFPLKS